LPAKFHIHPAHSEFVTDNVMNNEDGPSASQGQIRYNFVFVRIHQNKTEGFAALDLVWHRKGRKVRC
jgi:hypothetical protein